MPRRPERPQRGWWHRIYVRLWGSQEFLGLSDAERVFAFYVLTGPQANRIGIFKLSLGTAAEDLAIEVTDARGRLEKVCATFDWHYDHVGRVMWIPRWWHWNPPGLTNNFKGWLTDLHDVPDSPLVAEFLANESYFAEQPLEIFRERTAERKATASRTALPTGSRTALKAASEAALDSLPQTRRGTDPDPDPDPSPDEVQGYLDSGNSQLNSLSVMRGTSASGKRGRGGMTSPCAITQGLKR